MALVLAEIRRSWVYSPSFLDLLLYEFWRREAEVFSNIWVNCDLNKLVSSSTFLVLVWFEWGQPAVGAPNEIYQASTSTWRIIWRSKIPLHSNLVVPVITRFGSVALWNWSLAHMGCLLLRECKLFGDEDWSQLLLFLWTNTIRRGFKTFLTILWRRYLSSLISLRPSQSIRAQKSNMFAWVVPCERVRSAWCSKAALVLCWWLL